MAKDLNKVMLTGRLGKDPEVRVTPNGISVATFSVASSRNVRDGENWKEETEWFRVVAWRDMADRYSNILKKGSHVMVEGRLQTREYQDQQGQKRYSTEVIANDIYLLGPKQQQSSDGGDEWANTGNTGGNYSNQRPASNSRPSRSTNEYNDEMEPEDIPF